MYWFVRRPDIEGVKCVLTRGEQVLLVRHTYGHRRWDLPGGALHRGEPPTTTATREMREELGVTVSEWRELGTLATSVDFRHDLMHLFHAEVGGEPLTVDPCELATVQWFERHALPADRSPLVGAIVGFLDPD
jgi:8-oxo-dGTP pyrophosphatase MutT (NUDIX family)